MDKELTPLEALEKAKMDMDYHRKYECHYYYPKKEREEYFSTIETALKEHNKVLVANIKIGSENNILNTTLDKLNERLARYENVLEIFKKYMMSPYSFIECSTYKEFFSQCRYEHLMAMSDIPSEEEYDCVREVLL